MGLFSTGNFAKPAAEARESGEQGTNTLRELKMVTTNKKLSVKKELFFGRKSIREIHQKVFEVLEKFRKNHNGFRFIVRKNESKKNSV